MGEAEALSSGVKLLIDDEQLRAGYIERGYANLRRFSWDRCARETVAANRRAANDGR
jgi:glycosyltransferase involved in cell wall biosynthesis